MWDTSKDYRLKVAEKAIEQFIRVVEGSNLRGSWNKKQVRMIAKNMNPDIQTLYYSYVTPQELAKAPQIDNLLNSVDEIIENLGGEDYSRKFLSEVKGDEREKLELSLSKIKFFIYTIRELPARLNLGEIDDPVIGVDIKVGELVSVSKHPKTDTLMVCNVNLGSRAITVITNDLSVKDNDRVGVALLPPSAFMGISSEGMFLGAGEGILKNVEGELGSLPQHIDVAALNETRNLVDQFIKE
ncbi:tRNA-binding protein [Methanosphaera sp. Vir-13MRS]|uniref:tRNA-binding protein n=1 Tax=Candidatus Methanosphaera massiliense TaxID=3017187 RepID=UPI00238068BD|nr:tRNA-binding protein [Candidatus Methanosphaera massiliense]MDE4077539.1 tRNA-binding protein [Candidatus Methanosphaera massiliense]